MKLRQRWLVIGAGVLSFIIVAGAVLLRSPEARRPPIGWWVDRLQIEGRGLVTRLHVGAGEPMDHVVLEWTGTCARRVDIDAKGQRVVAYEIGGGCPGKQSLVITVYTVSGRRYVGRISDVPEFLRST